MSKEHRDCGWVCGCGFGRRGSLLALGTSEGRAAWASSGGFFPKATMVGPSHQDLSFQMQGAGYMAGHCRPEQMCLGCRARAVGGGGKCIVFCSKDSGNKMYEMSMFPKKVRSDLENVIGTN